MTVQPIALSEPEARRLTERIRTALDRVSTAWADLGERYRISPQAIDAYRL